VAQWYIPEILVQRRLRLQDLTFKASLEYIRQLASKKRKKEKKKEGRRVEREEGKERRKK
jgi:hypothetical protein